MTLIEHSLIQFENVQNLYFSATLGLYDLEPQLTPSINLVQAAASMVYFWTLEKQI